MYLKELLNKNGHKLVKHDNCVDGHKYESVFNYSERHGGTVDSFKYYNDYVVDVTENKCYVLICNGYNGDDSVSVYWNEADAHKAMLNELDTEIKSLEAEGYKIREGYSSCTAEVYVPDMDIHYDWIIEETTII